MNAISMSATERNVLTSGAADILAPVVYATGKNGEQADAAEPQRAAAPATGTSYQVPVAADGNAGEENAGERQPAPVPAAATEKAAPTRISPWATWIMVLLATVALISAGLAVTATRRETAAEKTAHDAVEEREHALRAEAESKAQRDQAEAALQTATGERNQAQAEADAARRGAQTSRAVLAFLQDTLLTAGRPKKAWLDEPDKQVSLRKALDMAEAKLARALPDQPLVEASVREILGSAYLNLGESAPAVKDYERALALRQAISGDTHPDTIACRDQLAVAYRVAGRVDDAAELFNGRTDSPRYASVLALHGSMLLSQKKASAAERRLRECLAIRQRLQPDHWTTFDAKSLLGEALLAQKKYAEAEPLLLDGHQGLRKHQSKIPIHDRTCIPRALERLVGLYGAWNKKDEADRWRKELAAVTAVPK
jgi:tetratricopeptide (TPR) repeat protein